MSIVNEIRLTGRLTKDAELKYTSSGTAITNMSIAVGRNVKEGDAYKEVTDFFELTMFGSRGEKLSQYLLKGTKISILGELRQDSWVDKNGSKRYKISIVVTDIDINFPPKQTNNNSQTYQQQSNYKQQQYEQQQKAPSVDIDDEQIPF